MQADLEGMSQKHISELENAAREREILSSKHASELDSARSELESTREVHGKKLEELNHEHSNRLEHIKVTHSGELSNLQDVNKNEFDTLRRQHSEELELLKGNHNREFSELKTAHLTEFAQLKQEHATLLQKMTNDLDDVHKTYKSSASEKEIEHTKAVDHVTAELAAITATYQTTVDVLANVKDSLATAEEAIKELTVKNQDLELKLVTGTESAREAIVVSDAEVAKLRKALADSREKVAALERKDALYTERHLKEAAERENELLIATTEIASLREKLAVNFSFPNNTDCRTSTPKKTNNLQRKRQNYFKIKNSR